jgi:hypothetical protein
VKGSSITTHNFNDAGAAVRYSLSIAGRMLYVSDKGFFKDGEEAVTFTEGACFSRNPA